MAEARLLRRRVQHVVVQVCPQQVQTVLDEEHAQPQLRLLGIDALGQLLELDLVWTDTQAYKLGY